jgi:hypothetical protein
MKSVVREYGGAWTMPYDVNYGAGVQRSTEAAEGGIKLQ